MPNMRRLSRSICQKCAPTVAFPHLPGNARHTMRSSHGAHQDRPGGHRFLYKRTDGGYAKGSRHLERTQGSPGRARMVIPGTQKIYKECIKEGLVDIFIDAGCSFNTPSCGPCMGGHMGVLAAGEKCVSTTNRNLWEGWDMWTPSSIWHPRRLRRPALSRATLPIQRKQVKCNAGKGRVLNTETTWTRM